MEVIMYSKKNCPLCDKAMDVLMDLKDEFSLNIQEVDIYEDDQLLEKYQIMIPVVEIEGVEVAYGIVDMITVREFLLSVKK